VFLYGKKKYSVTVLCILKENNTSIYKEIHHRKRKIILSQIPFISLHNILLIARTILTVKN